VRKQNEPLAFVIRELFNSMGCHNLKLWGWITNAGNHLTGIFHFFSLLSILKNPSLHLHHSANLNVNKPI
jgi:hypothetical protein